MLNKILLIKHAIPRYGTVCTNAYGYTATSTYFAKYSTGSYYMYKSIKEFYFYYLKGSGTSSWLRWDLPVQGQA
jgi:hypothetical protein